MEAMTTSPGDEGAVAASFSAGTAHFIPSMPPAEMDFARWLAARTAPGAATVLLKPPGTAAALHLPRVRPPRACPPVGHGPRRRGSAPAVHAAYLIDIDGLSPRHLAASGLLPFSTERAVRQQVRDGRLTAADLGAWPWAVVDGQPLPRNWWADRLFALALQEWSVGELHPLALGSELHPLRPRRFTATARLPVA
jgi:hypothetical protein